VAQLGQRFDEFERRSIQAKLDALPDIDAAPDDGDLEVKPAKTELEDVLDDQGDLPNELESGAPPPLGSYPTLGQEPPQTPQLPDISLNSVGRSDFTCRRDWKAFKRRMRA
jgi:hypothetical protein